MKKLRIRVTKQDIAKGLRNTPDACPIARAMRRVDPGHISHVLVRSNEVTWAHDDGRCKTMERAALSRSAQRFIWAFDTKGRKAKAVKPFTFLVQP